MQQRDQEQGRRGASRAARIGSVAAVAALALTVTACGSSSKKSGSKAPSGSLSPYASKSAGAKNAAPAPKVTHVLVTDTDTKMTLSVATFSPGNYNFSLKNTGRGKHAVAINGPGLKNQTGATVLAGGTTDLIVPLVKGSYTVWSPVGGDRAAGMTTKITVN